MDRDPMIYLRISASAADAAAVNTSIKTFLANGLNSFFTNDKPVICKGPRRQPRNLPDCIVLEG